MTTKRVVVYLDDEQLDALDSVVFERRRSDKSYSRSQAVRDWIETLSRENERVPQVAQVQQVAQVAYVPQVAQVQGEHVPQVAQDPSLHTRARAEFSNTYRKHQENEENENENENDDTNENENVDHPPVLVDDVRARAVLAAVNSVGMPRGWWRETWPLKPTRRWMLPHFARLLDSHPDPNVWLEDLELVADDVDKKCSRGRPGLNEVLHALEAYWKEQSMTFSQEDIDWLDAQQYVKYDHGRNGLFCLEGIVAAMRRGFTWAALERDVEPIRSVTLQAGAIWNIPQHTLKRLAFEMLQQPEEEVDRETA